MPVRKIRLPFPTRRKHSRIFFVLLLQLVAVGVIFICYSFSTQMTVAALMIAESADLPIGSQVLSATDYDRISDSWESLYADGSSGSGDNLILGEAGASGMLINAMQGGMYKEMLEIIQGHCDWTYMHPEVQPKTNSEGEVYPSLVGFLGTMLCETAVQSNKMPWATLSADAYENDGKHTLADYNSAVIREEQGATLSSIYLDWGSLKCSYAVDDRTHLYFGPSNASIYPSETHTGTRWPSTINGYGISEGTLRTKADTDAAYFPDQVSISLQVGWMSIGESSPFDTAALTELSFNCLPYYIYNCGPAGAPATIGIGTGYRSSPQVVDSRNWSEKNTLSYSTVASMGFNELSAPIEDILNGLLTNYEEITAGIWDENSMAPLSTPDYTGMAACAIKLTQDMFTTPEREQAWHNWISGSNGAAFIRGATIAYRAITGDITATQDEVREFMDDIDVQTIDTSFYGTPYEENAMWGTGSNQIDYYWYGDDCEIYNANGEGPRPALRAGGFRARGPYAVMIGGVYLYMHMLRYAGVECTWEEAYLDANGLLIQEAPGSSTGSGSSTSLIDPDTGETVIADNSSLASAAVSYAWPTTAQAKGNDGTKLYQAVFDVVLPGDIYHRSCDRSVAAAVRWAGYDDNYPAGAVVSQEAYLTTSPKWEEIDWGGDITKLQPGDILVATPGTWGDHTVLYVGYDLPKKIQNLTDVNVVEGSYSSTDYANSARSPGCTRTTGGYIGELTLYRAFRNVQRETNSNYVNVPIKLE